MVLVPSCSVRPIYLYYYIYIIHAHSQLAELKIPSTAAREESQFVPVLRVQSAVTNLLTFRGRLSETASAN
jgi:hypothetical protein